MVCSHLLSGNSIISPSVIIRFLIFLSTIHFTATLNFNLTSFSPNDEEINYERDAFAADKAIQLTKNLAGQSVVTSIGRVTYKKPLHLWDKASRNLTHFTTHFTFVIDSRNQTSYGDGIAFFLVPNGSRVPELAKEGGALGLTNDSQPLDTTINKFVAVEFDIFKNSWDPENSTEHVAIDINSMSSQVSVPWFNGSSSIIEGWTNEAWISYASSSKELNVVFRTSLNGNDKAANQSLNFVVDLRDYLPEWVNFGFSAATGWALSYNRINSWAFDSSLESSEDETGQTDLITEVPIVRKIQDITPILPIPSNSNPVAVVPIPSNSNPVAVVPIPSNSNPVAEVPIPSNSDPVAEVPIPSNSDPVAEVPMPSNSNPVAEVPIPSNSYPVEEAPLPSKSKNNKMGLVVGLAVGGFVLVCASGIFLILKKKKREEIEDNILVEADSMDGEFEKGAGPKKFSYNSLAKATNNFAQHEKLGEGGFGGVYKGFLRELNFYVAVKRVSRDSSQGIKEYASEVRIISRLRHKNLVQLIGWCHEQNNLLLVYEYMQNGSLDSHLFKGQSLLSWSARYKIAQGLASVLLYLHEEWEQCVVHRDIKSSNVMLDSSFNTKLGDFGLARLVDHDKGAQTTIVAGTRGYMAPECFITGQASRESDVFSFGVVALEIACGRKPIDPKVEESRRELVKWVWDLYGIEQILEAADPKLSGDYDEQEMKRLMIVGLWCAHPDSTIRPSIRQAIHVLNIDAPLPALPPKMPVATYSTPSNLSSMSLDYSVATTQSSQTRSSGYN